MKIWIVDAFSDKPFTGNPAAVTIVEEFPSEDMCQRIAAEINLPETAFLKPLGPNHFHIRCLLLLQKSNFVAMELLLQHIFYFKKK